MPSVHTIQNMINRAKHCLQMCLSALKCSCAEPKARARSAGSIYEQKKGPCHCCFNLFARKNFKKLQESIDSKILMEVASASPTSPAGSPVSLALSTPGSPALGTPEQDYEEIQRDVDEIFRVMNMAPCPGSRASQQRINEYLQSEDVTRFLDKLVNMMYYHFNVFDSDTKQAALSGKTFSESALLPNMGQATNLPVLNSFVKFEVATYIKKLCNFTQKDPLDYLNNVDLFEICMEQQQSPPLSVHSHVSGHSFNSQRYDIFERSMVHPKACVPSFISADVPAIVLRTPQEEKTESSSPNTVSLQSALKSPLTEGQLMTETVVLELTRKVFKNVSVGQREKDHYQTFVDRLTQKAQEEIDLHGWQIRKVGKNLNTIVKGVMRSLKKEYGTSKRFCEALLTESDAFEDTVMKYLQIHIDLELYKMPSLLSRICKFICCC